jgi:hypothetical protein
MNSKLHNKLKANHSLRPNLMFAIRAVWTLSYIINWKQITAVLYEQKKCPRAVWTLSYIINWKQITARSSRNFSTGRCMNSKLHNKLKANHSFSRSRCWESGGCMNSKLHNKLKANHSRTRPWNCNQSAVWTLSYIINWKQITASRWPLLMTGTLYEL